MRLQLIIAGFIFSLMLSGQTHKKLNAEFIHLLSYPPNTDIAFLVKGNPASVRNFVIQHNGTFKYAAGDVCSVVLPVAAIFQLELQPFVQRMEFHYNRNKPLDDSTNVKNNVAILQTPTPPVNSAITGNNVLIGIIDTGIDYAHPDFSDTAGNTRVRWLWDQTKPVAPNTPQPYNYGQEWNNNQMDSGYCTHVDYQYMGHGTKVSGVAAGNGKSNPSYKGIATEAELIAVGVDFNSNGPVILDAVNYCVQKANQLGKPLVINLSLGDYFGSHDGTDLQAQGIDALIAGIPDRAVVAAAGNAGNYKFHLKYPLSNDTNLTFMRNNSGLISFPLYSDTNDFKNAKFTVGVYGPGFAYKGNIGFKSINYCLGQTTSDTITFNNNRIGIVDLTAALNGKTYELWVDVKQDSTNYNWTFETTGQGTFDAWNFDFRHTGLPSTSTLPRMIYYKRPDSLQTICTSFQCSNEVITVGNYVARTGYVDVNNNYVATAAYSNDLSYNSSLGPTRDLRTKPEICATGDHIITVGSQIICQQVIQNFPSSPSPITTDSLHIVFDGTSAAAPCVAGFVAQAMQVFSGASNQIHRTGIICGARHDGYTGSQFPSNKWGYGKLDGWNSVNCLILGIKINDQKKNLKIFPNPTTGIFQIEETENNIQSIVIRNSNGQIIKSQFNTMSNQIDMSNNPKGFYFIEIIYHNSSRGYGKLILN